MKANKPALWVPTLYLAEGIPYTAVMILSLIFYKVEGLSNTDIALYTGWFYLPWLIKPLWSPVVEMLRTSKFWIVTCQILLGAALGSVGLTLPFDNWLNYTLILFWLAAFMSATHDIAADGFYIEALDDKQQAGWVGVRSTFYKIAMMLCQGGLVILAGILEKKYSVNVAWTITFAILGVLMALFGVYHMFILPKTEKAAALESEPKNKIRNNVWDQIKTFCQKDNLLIVLGFLLLYRLGEAQLSKMALPFLMDSPDNGGLGLSTEAVGTISGTFGLIAMIAGGILGGIAIAAIGLRKWLIPMILCLNLPDIFYAILSATQCDNFFAVAAVTAVEQFGYGFGFTAYSVFMLRVSKGEFSTSHYAICTAFMAAGMMLPGMVSGWLQSILGYTSFFVWVTICAIPSLILAVCAKRTKYLTDER